MTTLDRTWTVSLNNVPPTTTLLAQAQATLYAFKENYLAAGWTVEGSSNSSAGGMDGVDRWASSANLVWAAAGVAHSWIVLKSPAGYLPSSKFVYLLLACSTGASVHLINAGWASAPYTGGTATADPTAPANARAFANKQFLTSPVTASKYHLLRNTTGDVLNLTSRDTSQQFQHAQGFLQTQPSAESGDNYPGLAWMAWSTTNALTVANSTSSSHTAVFYNDGTILANNTAGIINLSISSTDVMSAFPLAGSSISGSYPAMPAYLASVTAAKTTIKGYLVDIRLGPSGTGVVVGTVEPATGTTTTMLAGELWVPNGGVTPLL